MALQGSTPQLLVWVHSFICCLSGLHLSCGSCIAIVAVRPALVALQEDEPRGDRRAGQQAAGEDDVAAAAEALVSKRSVSPC